MIFRQLFDPDSSTYTYLVADTQSRQGRIVDPVRVHAQRDLGLLTGDTLRIGGCGRTDFQQGDAGTLCDSITRRLFTLPEDTLVYPGHDYRGRHVSTIAEEKSTNPRLAGQTRDQFIEIMKNLNLPMPGKIGEAVSANLRGGKTDG